MIELGSVVVVIGRNKFIVVLTKGTKGRNEEILDKGFVHDTIKNFNYMLVQLRKVNEGLSESSFSGMILLDIP